MPKLAAFSPLILALLACSTSPLTRTARDGNRGELLTELKREHDLGKLDTAHLKDAARGLLEGDIARSRGPSGDATVASLSSCAGALEGALSERADTHDSVGGEAARLLFERGSWCGGTDDYADDELGTWRALSALDADGRGDADLERRRRFFVDGDERVRRAALDAAYAAHDERDLDALLQASRLDPNPLTRSRATRAAGAIGGQLVVAKLSERFTTVDETERLTYLEAWAQPASYSAGGRDELVRVAKQDLGLVGLAAAATLLRVEPSESATRGEMLGRLLQATRDGSRGERRYALAELPAEGEETAKALREAAKDGDPDVALLATVRLAGREPDRAAAEKRLLAWAAQEDSLGRQARAALAVYGSAAVLPTLREGARSEDPNLRAASGRALIRLGQASEAYFLLGDTDSSVRRGFACTLLSGR